MSERGAKGKPGTCLLCGKPIVMHGEIVPVWFHAACAHELGQVPEKERDAYMAARFEARERKEKAARAAADKQASGVLELPFG